MTSMTGSRLVRRVRQQRDLPGPDDGNAESALVLRAGPRDSPRQHLAALRHEAAQQLHVLVVDVVDLVCAELADLAPAEQPAALPHLAVGLLVVAASAAASRSA